MCNTPSSTSFLDFAPEVVQHILKQLFARKSYEWCYNEPIHDLAAIKAIGTCRLTCRYLNTVARPLAFHSVSLNCTKSVGRLSQFLGMLDDDPTLGSTVRILWLYRLSSNSDSAGGGLDSLVVSRKELWNNVELPRIFSRLTGLKMFAFEIFDLRLTSNGYSAWHQLGEEMKAGILSLTLRPSVTSLKFSNVTSLPVDLIASPPNIVHLDISNIDGIPEFDDVQVPYQSSRHHSNLDTPPQSHCEDGLRVKSLKADDSCTSLYPLHPIVEERLSWGGCDPAHLSAALCRSGKSIQDLSVYIQYRTVQDIITFSNALQPPLHTLESLSKLRVHGSQWVDLPFIIGLAAFLNIQFARPSPHIKCFQIDMTFLPYERALLKVMSSNSGLSPSQWQDLEQAIQTSFPHLETLVFKLPSRGFDKEQWSERFKVLIELALPGMKELMRVTVT